MNHLFATGFHHSGFRFSFPEPDGFLMLGLGLGIVAAIILIQFLAFLFQWLWNKTLPELFGWKPIRFWQSVRLLLLAWIMAIPFSCHRDETGSSASASQSAVAPPSAKPLK